MALYSWLCPTCGVRYRKMTDRKMSDFGEMSCDKDGSILVSENQVSSMVTERLDNGIMPKAIERLKDVEEMVKERSVVKEDSHLV